MPGEGRGTTAGLQHTMVSSSMASHDAGRKLSLLNFSGKIIQFQRAERERERERERDRGREKRESAREEFIRKEQAAARENGDV